MGVRVVTDSSAVIPGAWREGIPLHVVPTELAWETGEVSRSDMPYAELAARLARGERPPKTSTPSPGRYEEIYKELLSVDDALLVVCPSSELSGTYSSAVLAARSVGEDRTYVVDAKTAAAGQGMVAVEAARTASAGGDIERVLARALDVATRVEIWATLSQMDFLRRSGRLPAIAAIGAGALGLQPVVRYAQGSPTPVGVTRSSRRGAERLLRAWQRSTQEGRLHLVLFHSDRAEEANDLETRIRGNVADAETAVVEVTAALASHTGPGLLGVAWFWDS
jgi:DegV family protein with EDD domain